MSGTGIDVVPNLPECPVPVIPAVFLCTYRTEHTTVFICDCLHFSCPKNNELLLSALLLLHCTAAAATAAAAAAAAAHDVLLCRSFCCAGTSTLFFTFGLKFCTEERKYATRKRSWHISKDHTSYMCLYYRVFAILPISVGLENM